MCGFYGKSISSKVIMKENGFALLEIIIVLVILIGLVFGAFYFKNSFFGQKPILETGTQAIDQAQDVKLKLETKSQHQSSTFKGLMK